MQAGVDPLSWIPNPLASGKENPRCHEPNLPYPPELRHPRVERARSGRAVRELAREFECSDQTLRNRVRQADLDEGRRNDGLTSAEREALRRLRRENRRLREERKILARAAAWFAREADSVPAQGKITKKCMKSNEFCDLMRPVECQAMNRPRERGNSSPDRVIGA